MSRKDRRAAAAEAAEALRRSQIADAQLRKTIDQAAPGAAKATEQLAGAFGGKVTGAGALAVLRRSFDADGDVVVS